MSFYEDNSLLEMIVIIFYTTRVPVTAGLQLKKADGSTTQRPEEGESQGGHLLIYLPTRKIVLGWFCPWPKISAFPGSGN